MPCSECSGKFAQVLRIDLLAPEVELLGSKVGLGSSAEVGEGGGIGDTPGSDMGEPANGHEERPTFTVDLGYLWGAWVWRPHRDSSTCSSAAKSVYFGEGELWQLPSSDAEGALATLEHWAAVDRRQKGLDLERVPPQPAPSTLGAKPTNSSSFASNPPPVVVLIERRAREVVVGWRPAVQGSVNEEAIVEVLASLPSDSSYQSTRLVSSPWQGVGVSDGEALPAELDPMGRLRSKHRTKQRGAPSRGSAKEKAKKIPDERENGTQLEHERVVQWVEIHRGWHNGCVVSKLAPSRTFHLRIRVGASQPRHVAVSTLPAPPPPPYLAQWMTVPGLSQRGGKEREKSRRTAKLIVGGKQAWERSEVHAGGQQSLLPIGWRYVTETYALHEAECRTLGEALDDPDSDLQEITSKMNFGNARWRTVLSCRSCIAHIPDIQASEPSPGHQQPGFRTVLASPPLGPGGRGGLVGSADGSEVLKDEVDRQELGKTGGKRVPYPRQFSAFRYFVQSAKQPAFKSGYSQVLLCEVPSSGRSSSAVPPSDCWESEPMPEVSGKLVGLWSDQAAQEDEVALLTFAEEMEYLVRSGWEPGRSAADVLGSTVGQQQLDEGWEEFWDEKRQRAYYHHQGTGTTQWSPPSDSQVHLTAQFSVT